MNIQIGSLLRLLLASRLSTADVFLEPKALSSAPRRSILANLEDYENSNSNRTRLATLHCRAKVQVQIVDQAAVVRPVDAAPGDMVDGDLLDMFETEDESAEALSLGGCGV